MSASYSCWFHRAARARSPPNEPPVISPALLGVGLGLGLRLGVGLGLGLGLGLANLVDDRAVDGDHLVALAALVVVRELARLVQRVAHERVAHGVLHGAQG